MADSDTPSTVPVGCSGQVLRLELLAQSTLDRQLSGTLRLDDVRIEHP